MRCSAMRVYTHVRFTSKAGLGSTEPVGPGDIHDINRLQEERGKGVNNTFPPFQNLVSNHIARWRH